MQAKWQSVKVPGSPAGVSHYRKGHSKATIERADDGSATGQLREGLFGLGTHVESWHRSPAPDDASMLERLEDTAHPPRFDNWKSTGQSAGETHYVGQNHRGLGKTVKATITRDGDEAEVKARAGIFGVQVEGHFFAPAPSDQEILKRISRNPDRD